MFILCFFKNKRSELSQRDKGRLTEGDMSLSKVQRVSGFFVHRFKKSFACFSCLGVVSPGSEVFLCGSSVGVASPLVCSVLLALSGSASLSEVLAVTRK